MLRVRIATALVAGALVLAGIFLLSPEQLAVAGAAVTAVAAWEWGRLAGCGSPLARAVFALAVGALGLTVWWLAPGVGLSWLAAALAFWCLVAAWLLAGGGPNMQARPGTRWGWLLAGLLLLPSLALAIGVLGQRPDWAGRALLLYAVGVVWAADIGAYFVGRFWGRHKLAPRVSAGKTREGLAGGVAAVAVYALIGAWLFGVTGPAWPGWLGVALGAGLLSVAGDLLESVLKREAGVKDSGRLLPGHGGLLDRIDSLIAATPAMVLGLAVMGRVVLP